MLLLSYLDFADAAEQTVVGGVISHRNPIDIAAMITISNRYIAIQYLCSDARHIHRIPIFHIVIVWIQESTESYSIVNAKSTRKSQADTAASNPQFNTGKPPIVANEHITRGSCDGPAIDIDRCAAASIHAYVTRKAASIDRHLSTGVTLHSISAHFDITVMNRQRASVTIYTAIIRISVSPNLHRPIDRQGSQISNAVKPRRIRRIVRSIGNDAAAADQRNISA